MSWNPKGSCVEICSCELIRACDLPFDHGATYDFFRVTLVGIYYDEPDRAELRNSETCVTRAAGSKAATLAACSSPPRSAGTSCASCPMNEEGITQWPRKTASRQPTDKVTP